MASALTGSVTIAGYVALFAAVGMVFVFVNLLIGRFLRPADPHEEKLEIYECGEPAIGSSFVQFDLRFYVVALIFIVFDVEVAFLFPWATVFGKSHLLAHSASEVAAVTALDTGQTAEMTSYQQGLLRELGVPNPAATTGDVVQGGQTLFNLSVIEVLVFFVILLIGFAYVWRMGALDWVRATINEPPNQTRRRRGERSESKMVSVLSA